MVWDKEKIKEVFKQKILLKKKQWDLIKQSDFLEAWMLYPLIILQKWEVDGFSWVEEFVESFWFKYNSKWKYTSKHAIDRYFRENMVKHIKWNKMLTQNEITKLWHLGWLQAVQRWTYWYSWLRDFAKKNWFLSGKSDLHIDNVESFINQRIIPLCKKWYFIPEVTLRSRFPKLYEMLKNKEIPWYNSYSDLAKKRWYKIKKKRLSTTWMIENFEKYFEEKILPKVKRNKLIVKEISLEHPMWYKTLNSWKIDWYKNFKDFKQKRGFND